MSDHIRVEIADHVMEITFTRPDKKNALSNAMYGVWADALDLAEADPAIRAVIHTGEGDAFTAGNDLQDFMQVASGMASGPRHVGRVLQNLAKAQKPLIAAVNGLAVGVGTTMLLHCDLVYVAAAAKLTTPFVGLGLVPEAASSLLLPQAIGAKRAYAMFALGEAISGAEAVTFGLANRAFPTAAEALAAARAAGQALVNRPPQALALTKALMRDGEALGALMLKEGALFEQQLRSDEAREAFTAFMERRPARFAPHSN
jgi:enoyl-CoA hydratase/carnithine racemase